MAKVSLKKITKIMKGIDLCMLTTVSGRGISAGRPMSNNGDVDYDGTSYFFTLEKNRMIRELKKNANVSLAFADLKLLKKTFISVSGRAKLSKNRSKMEEHWNKDLELWFKDGLDTPGITLIEVTARHIKYWSNGEEGEWTKTSRS